MSDNAFVSFLVSTLAALLVSVAAILIFSLIVMATGLGSGFVTFINYLIRLISLTVGIFTFASGNRGVLKGMGFGLSYAILSTIVFSLIGGSFSFDLKLLADFIYCVAVGAVLGTLAVNVKK